MANVYRADHVGALIKPEALLAAQKAFASGNVDAAAKAAAEDAAISEALALQKAIVMTVVTDGEFRRTDDDEPYASALAGLKRSGTPVRNTSLQSVYAVCGTIEQTSRLAAREVDFLKAKTQSRFKICLASPSTLALRLYKPGVTEAAYRTVIDLATALGEILRSEINSLIQDGVPYVQLNGSAYHALFEGVGTELLGLPDKDRGALFDELVAVDAASLKAINRSSSATLAMRVDRVPELNDGSDRYERMITRLLEQLPIDRVLLEYGEPQDHDFTSLAALAAGKMAVLGLVRTEGEPEEIGAVIERIERAARFMLEDHIALSPRRSFVNVPGRPVSAQLQQQHHTLLRTSEVVQQFWGLEL
jgi:5-methyltetrahydropteroyltriglutamate--homocysteine methyltransferase